MIVQERLNLENIIEAFEKSKINKTLPAKVLDFKQKAFDRFIEIGLPSSKDEIWKYVDIKALLSADFAKIQAPNSYNLADIKNFVQSKILKECTGSCLVFLDGRFTEEFSDLKSLEGINISLLEDSFETNPLFETEDCFQLLNSVFFDKALSINIPKETSIKQPIQILSLSSFDGHSSYPRIHFNLGQRSTAQLVFLSKHLNSSLEGKATNNSCNNIVFLGNLNRASKLDLTFIQNEDKPLKGNSLSFAFTKILQEADSEFCLHSFSLGANLSRHRVEVDLNGENSRSSLSGLYVVSDENSTHNQLVLNHNLPNCYSEQIYKGILDDKAHAEFTGTINVLKDAQKTDARQLNKNLLISKEAKVDTRPQLQIEADDVKCSHGATIGQLEDEQIFYLASRGISKEEARQILTYGFAEEIIEKVKIPSLRKRLDTFFLANIHS